MLNFFELYDIPVSFHPDAAAVKNKFYELSRKYHPDRFANAAHADKMESLTMSALNNDAYKTFSNRDKTMAYILKLKGLLQDEEKYNLPPAFLMAMMELNEAISEYETEPADTNSYKQAKNELDEELESWNEATEKLTLQFDKGDESEALLLQIKDYYFRKKYLLRIQERIDKFATH